MADTQIPAPAAAAQPQGQNSPNVEGQQPTTQAETKDLSSQFAHLAKKAKAFREEQRRFQQEREAFQRDRETWQAQNQTKYQGFEERVTKDPIGILEERGITRDQLATLLLNESNPDTANLMFQLQQENKQLRQRIDQVDKRFEENEKSAYQGALTQIRNDAKMLVNSEAANFEMIGLGGDDAIEAVVELCRVTWDEEQILLPVEEAAKQVEQELFERSLRLANSAKIKAKLTAPAEPAAQPQQTQGQPSKTQPTKTLNSQAAQATSKPMSPRQRAILAFQGKLS